MSVASETLLDVATEPAGGGRLWLSLRYALRDLRGGLRGFYVFIACIALGVLAIAGVGSVAAILNEGIGKAGRVILGGDRLGFVAFNAVEDRERGWADHSNGPHEFHWLAATRADGNFVQHASTTSATK